MLIASNAKNLVGQFLADKDLTLGIVTLFSNEKNEKMAGEGLIVN